VAPDFTLVLGEGGQYTLSEGTKPVYLIFWAEWCPTCRRELPVVDALAAEYADEVDFVAPAWKSDFEATQARANELFLSGSIQWGLDEQDRIFELYGVPYQPVTVLIAGDQTVVEAWAGLRGEDELRTAIDDLIALSG
jgi:thiol-disulfide isomerase/thioredoxin